MHMRRLGMSLVRLHTICSYLFLNVSLYRRFRNYNFDVVE